MEGSLLRLLGRQRSKLYIHLLTFQMQSHGLWMNPEIGSQLAHGGPGPVADHQPVDLGRT